MSDSYRPLHFGDGELIGATLHGSRDDAECAFALAVEQASRQAEEADIDCRVELWGEDTLLAMFDTLDRA